MAKIVDVRYENPTHFDVYWWLKLLMYVRYENPTQVVVNRHRLLLRKKTSLILLETDRSLNHLKS